MNRMLKFVVVCAAALALAVAFVGCSSQTYTPPTKTAVVETPTIGVSKTLRVGVDASKTPLASQLSGLIVGLDVDLAAAIADEMGLGLQIIDVGSDPEGALSDGEVDIVMGLDKSNTGLSCWLSDAYQETSVVLFALSSNTTVPDASSNPTIAAQTSSMSAWEVNNQFGNNAIVSTTSLSAAFEELEAGNVDYVAADAVIGSYVAASLNLDVHMVALMEQVGGYSIGILQSNTALQQAVTTALNSVMGNGVASLIETKWLGGPLDLNSLPMLATATVASTTNTNATATESDSDELTVEDVLAQAGSGSGGTASSSSSSSGDETVSQGVETAGSNAVVVTEDGTLE